MTDRRSGGQRLRASKSGTSGGSLPNEEGLAALGETVDQHHGVVPRRSRAARSRGRRIRRRIGFGALALILVVAIVAGGGWWYINYRFNQLPKVACKTCVPAKPGYVNILEIGSDSRAGLVGALGRQAGAVSGQRSDSLKIIHIDTIHGTVATLSIPRDTMVRILDASLGAGNYNRINVNYGHGPSLIVRTIEANFGIPINYVVQVSFAGLIDVADALGGVWLNFKYPAHDAWSGLVVRHPGCQLIKNFEALAVVRSRHYYYNVKGLSYWPANYVNLSYAQLAQYGWIYDGLSDWSRIQRQDAFVKALINAGEHAYNPFTINSVLTNIPKGITLDKNLSLTTLVSLAWTFRHFKATDLTAFTLPDYPVQSPSYGDVLTVEQPQAQQMLVSIFGRQLLAVSAANAPLGSNLQPQVPPYVAISSVTPAWSLVTTTTTPNKHHHPTTTTVPVTTTTTNPNAQKVPTEAQTSFNPTPCQPA